MARFRLSASAQTDLINILAWTHAQFGELARQRYEALIATALRDIATDPERGGSSAQPELGADVRSWHLRLSRERARTASGVVQRPRHFLIYRVEGDTVLVARVLHDAMDAARHLEGDAPWLGT